MEPRVRAEQAGSRLGALRRKRASAEEIQAAERELAEAQFECRVEKALRRHGVPSQEVIDRVCERLQALIPA